MLQSIVNIMCNYRVCINLLIINIVKDETGDLVTGSYSILARWTAYFSQLLNVHGVHDVRQTETHTAVPLVPEPSAFEVDLAIEKIRSHK